MFPFLGFILLVFVRFAFLDFAFCLLCFCLFVLIWASVDFVCPFWFPFHDLSHVRGTLVATFGSCARIPRPRSLADAPVLEKRIPGDSTNAAWGESSPQHHGRLPSSSPPNILKIIQVTRAGMSQLRSRNPGCAGLCHSAAFALP
jgi:hypothetical protein